MKKYFLPIVLLVFLFGCEKDDDLKIDVGSNEVGLINDSKYDIFWGEDYISYFQGYQSTTPAGKTSKLPYSTKGYFLHSYDLSYTLYAFPEGGQTIKIYESNGVFDFSIE